MGLWRGDEYFGYRCDYAAEYLEVLRKLWRTGRTSHDGRFFKLDDCKSLPQPSRTIPIVCASQSDRGIQFTADTPTTVSSAARTTAWPTSPG